MFELDNDFLENLTDDEISVIERQLQQEKRLRILKTFLTEGTIKFVLNNYPVFLDKISLNSLRRSSKFYEKMESFDCNRLVKWYPIFVDYDRAKLLLSYLKSDGFEIREIVEYLGRSVEKDILDSDVINSKKDIKIMSDDEFIEENCKIIDLIDNDKINNEGFNNMISGSINKYNKLLRRLS